MIGRYDWCAMIWMYDARLRVYALVIYWFFLCQAEDGIRDLVRSRGLGDVYKRQASRTASLPMVIPRAAAAPATRTQCNAHPVAHHQACLLYTSDAADERSSVDLGGRRIIKKKKPCNITLRRL